MFAHNTATAIVLMLVVQAPTVQIADTHAEVDTIITDAREGQDPGSALKAIGVLRESLTLGKTLSRKSEERLLAMIVDPQANGVIQFKAFALLCDNVTDKNAERILTLVLSWIRQTRSIRPSVNDRRQIALSASWNVTYRPCRTILAPILDHILAPCGQGPLGLLLGNPGPERSRTIT